VANGIVYVGSQTSFNNNDGKLNAFSAAGCGQAVCAPLWQGLAGPQSILESSPAVSGGTVFVGAFDGKLYAFAASGCGQATCQPLWKDVDTLNLFDGSPAVGKGRVYTGLENGLAVYSASGCGQSQCDPLWTLFGSGEQAAVLSSPTVANGVVYAGRNTGEVLAWSASP